MAAHCVHGSSYATNIVCVPEWHNGIGAATLDLFIQAQLQQA